MSALYTRCIDVVLSHNPDGWEAPGFEVDEDGIMTRCWSRQSNCEDDCTDGVSIERFEWNACDLSIPRE